MVFKWAAFGTFVRNGAEPRKLRCRPRCLAMVELEPKARAKENQFGHHEVTYHFRRVAAWGPLPHYLCYTMYMGGVYCNQISAIVIVLIVVVFHLIIF